MKLKYNTVLVALLIGVSYPSQAMDIQDGDKLAIMGGNNRMEIWDWEPSGYSRLLTNELANVGVKKTPLVLPPGRTTEQMLANLQSDVIEQRPVLAVIMPGNADYNCFTTKTPSESYYANLKAIVEQLKAESIKPVLVTSYVLNSDRNFSPNQNTAQFNEVIRTLAQELNVKLIDFTNVVDQEQTSVNLDGSYASKALVNQMFAGEVLRVLGYSDQEVAACRQAWLDTPGLVQTVQTP